ncbi:clan AA aspartic protease [Pseudoflavitalea sp. G-6-1-2]|uniref:aspartyl protease family protein n=1 Tax=Pseudoflavitalea sp. G-6-1-2 TaxID=2728841 RepID=UPI00146F0162|nr:aspartyl protease family protein [Pseudoflavitalea sp. G-6-1-2]NML20133.1 clan AA aspartic protease [Pseudoflavitalea sp. G-6-1-2]
MGLIYAEIELINGLESGLARKSQFCIDEVKKIRVSMLVDSGAYYLTINENIQEVLQLPVVRQKRVQLADGRFEVYDVVAPVELWFENRDTVCEAIVLPGDNEPLLGAIPMEALDVIIDPKRQQMVVHPDHPDGPILKLKSAVRTNS